LYGKDLFTLAYPLACVYLLVWFSFLQWSPIPWCEQIWEPLVIVVTMGMLQR